MPKFLKKFILSFLAFLVLFASSASEILAACTQVASNQTTCTGTQTVACSQTMPNAGGLKRYCCDTQTDCDSTKAGLQQQITNNMASSTTTTTTDTSWYNSGPLDFFQKVFDKGNNDIFGERYTYAQVTWVSYSLIGVLAGFAGNLIDIPTILKQIQENPQQGLNMLMDPKGKIAQTSDPMMTVISQFYLSPPASSAYWLSQKIDNFSIIKKAYAAPTNGFGFSSLSMFITLWSASRNIAYAVMVVILLAIAFAVMFRLKIAPQLTVTIQSALPKVASTLILITFSYAIVGFMIDLMYLIFGVIAYGLNASGALIGTSLTPKILFDSFRASTITGAVFSTAGPGGSAVLIIVLLVLAVLTFVPGFGAFALGLLIAILLFFVKTFIMLAQTYFSLIINLVFGPIILLSEAIPFIKASAIGWFKSVLADILVFFFVGILFLVFSLLSTVIGNGAAVQGWSPPYLGFSPFWMQIILWVGLWSLLPNVKDMVYRMMERSSAEIGIPRDLEGHLKTGVESLKRVGQTTQIIPPPTTTVSQPTVPVPTTP